MANRLKPNEPIGKEIRRVLRRHVDRALADLDQSTDDKAIHGVRKRLKKIRAVLRLVRDEIGEKAYRRENECFRDAARPLTELRDATVLVDAMSQLREQFKDQAPPDLFARAGDALKANRRIIRDHVIGEQNNLAPVIQLLEDAAARFSDWSAQVGRRTLRRGLKRSFKRSYEAYLTATAEPTAENRHEWRKQAKYFMHQLEILEKLWPHGMEEFGNSFDELGKLLGDDRDLDLLQQKISSDRGAFGGEIAVDSLLRLIERRSGQFQERAFLTGRRIYEIGSKPPKLHLGRAG